MSKRLRTLLLAGTMLALLTACNTTTIKHNYTFTGEGELWSAEYIQKATEKFVDKKDQPRNYETSHNSTLELKYKGEQTDLNKIKSFKYCFKRSSGETKLTLNDIQGIRKEDLKYVRAGSGTSFEQEDSIIKVEVEWDGQKEQFDLQVHK